MTDWGKYSDAEIYDLEVTNVKAHYEGRNGITVTVRRLTEEHPKGDGKVGTLFLDLRDIIVNHLPDWVSTGGEFYVEQDMDNNYEWQNRIEWEDE